MIYPLIQVKKNTWVQSDDCAVKDAVADGRIDDRRYESYCHMIEDDEEAK